MKTVRIATRKSALSLAQTRLVCDRIQKAGYETEIITVSTRGDLDQTNSLSVIGGDGLFIREIEKKLLAKEADIAVHSAKDLPYELMSGLVIAATPEQADAEDCIVWREGEGNLKIIGTSSPRRAEAVKKLYPDAQCRDIRGNVDTRLRKLREGQYDAIVLAKAGLDRLAPDLTGLTIRKMTCEEMIPAPCQGILAAECREEDEEMRSLLSSINDEKAWKRFEIERKVFCEFKVDCSTPIGVYARCNETDFELFVTLDGHSKKLRLDYDKQHELLSLLY